MFKIKIEEKFNPKKDIAGKWFVKYDMSIDKPVFTSDECEAGVFILDQNDKMALHGNLMALYDRFGIKGTPVAYNTKDIKITTSL